MAELQLELEQLKENLRVKQEEFDDEQKQVTEMKDRHMALENQLSEYLCTINDQAKVAIEIFLNYVSIYLYS